MRLAGALAADRAPGSDGPSGPVDWTGDPLAEALREKIERLREDPDAFAAGAPDPFVAALEAERSAAVARDAA